jgi:hypothetical protein
MHRLGLFASTLLVIGCSKDQPKELAPSPSPSAAASSEKAPALNSGAISPANLGAIPEHLEGESKNRPTGTVRVEDVLDAFAKAGVTVHESRQHLASPYEAMYCMGTKAGHDLHMSICEYKDETTAESGKAMSLKAFGQGRRDIWRNKATTLTVRRGDEDAGDRALQEKLVATFRGLEPQAPDASR